MVSIISGARGEAMDIHTIQCFAKVYETCNYTKAADELFISRQTLRHSLKVLETELGAELFIYEGRGSLIATSCADTIYPIIQEMLASYARLKDVVRAHNSEKRKIRCGMMNGIHEVYHRDDFQMRQGLGVADNTMFVTSSSDLLRDQLQDGSLDSIFLISDKPDDDRFPSRVIETGTLSLMVNRSSSLADKTNISIDDLRGQNFVGQGMGYDIYERVAQECHYRGFELNTTYICSSPFDAALQVNGGFGVVLAYHSSITYYDVPNVICRPFTDPVIQWYLLQLIRKDHDFSQIDDSFWNFFEAFPAIHET